MLHSLILLLSCCVCQKKLLLMFMVAIGDAAYFYNPYDILVVLMITVIIGMEMRCKCLISRAQNCSGNGNHR